MQLKIPAFEYNVVNIYVNKTTFCLFSMSSLNWIRTCTKCTSELNNDPIRSNTIDIYEALIASCLFRATVNVQEY